MKSFSNNIIKFVKTHNNELTIGDDWHASQKMDDLYFHNMHVIVKICFMSVVKVKTVPCNIPPHSFLGSHPIHIGFIIQVQANRLGYSVDGFSREVVPSEN